MCERAYLSPLEPNPHTNYAQSVSLFGLCCPVALCELLLINLCDLQEKLDHLDRERDTIAAAETE